MRTRHMLVVAILAAAAMHTGATGMRMALEVRAGPHRATVRYGGAGPILREPAAGPHLGMVVAMGFSDLPAVRLDLEVAMRRSHPGESVPAAPAGRTLVLSPIGGVLVIITGGLRTLDWPGISRGPMTDMVLPAAWRL